ncbi:lytic polysaccharide monooxygenase [Actinoplanes sp. TBRC 11911]|uniref:lytic polysaccharide monooxygenase n=1 Tax=Actinoplanes sp. TBRC 11911 TaxID=2729386 RepID=UPI00145CC3F5|nr:lytic polysaccharide monooxygenase [Actinoplanes sp. TBRC 11911]NMO53613.1 lytic polysaccharide monooxygenase [Actinoplanes sp. TBRC 11911]
MIIRRLAAMAGVVTAAALLPALPAAAHGAPTTPISRTAACASGGSDTGAAACKAAKTANGGALGNFDNLRIPDVNGNDRARVPDGKLCSGGLDAYRGLDLARDDFPATSVSSGQTLKVKYRATIPHAGSFRIYLTNSGYKATKKLAWSDLGSKPLAEVKEPALHDGAYSMTVKLPQRTGRQILYIVWETSSTPDTYYSCSDLSFKAAAKPKPTTKAPASSAPASKKATASPAAAAPDTTTSAAPAATTEPSEQAQVLTPVGDQSSATLGHSLIAGAAVLGGGAVLWAAIGGIRRRRRQS